MTEVDGRGYGTLGWMLIMFGKTIPPTLITGGLVYYLLEVAQASVAVAALVIATCAYWAALLGGFE